MSQIRPKILLRYGRQNEPVRVPISDLLVDPVAQTFITVNTASAVSVLTVKNITGFAINQALLIGEPGNQGSEIIFTDISTAPTGSTITLVSATSFPHSAGTPVYALYFDKVEYFVASTATGAKTILTSKSIVADSETTNYNDIVSTTGYYYAGFFSSITQSITSITRSGTTATATKTAHGYSTGQYINISGANQTEYNGIFQITVLTSSTFTFTVTGSPATPATGTLLASTASPYSDPAPYGSYTLQSARSIIDSALNEINKNTSEVLSDEFAFQQLDSCQTEVLRELKRWSFMQKFDSIIGQVSTGSWKVAMPTDLDDQNTNKSVYNIRLGTQQRLVWVDKEKFDEFFVGVAYTTLGSILNVSDATMTLTDSSDFSSTGTVTIGANSYDYTANDTTTGILTLSSVVAAGKNAAAGADVFQGATQGLPTYWTTYGGYIYYTPNTSSTYNGKNIYMDYYIKQSRITKDSDEIIFPDSTVAQYYLCYKFLKKLANGKDSPDIQMYLAKFEARKQIMKNKEVMNRTFKFRPRLQNFNIQSEFSEDTPRWIRDANFPNTGF